MLRPRSRGEIRLASADPSAKAMIRANYLSDAEGYDLKLLVEGVKLSREIFAAERIRRLSRRRDLPRRDRRIERRRHRRSSGAKAETVYYLGLCLPHGARERRRGRRRPGTARARRARPARRRRFGDAITSRRQYERADDHDCRTRGGVDSRWRSARLAWAHLFWSSRATAIARPLDEQVNLLTFTRTRESGASLSY